LQPLLLVQKRVKRNKRLNFNLLKKQLLKSQPKIRRKPRSLLRLLVQKREKLNKTRIKIIPRRTSNVVFYCQFTACA
ncbi:electron transport complex, RnfABCDGE type, C subunit, partial [Vibrio parahaemolyticus VPTS-2009]